MKYRTTLSIFSTLLGVGVALFFLSSELTTAQKAPTEQTITLEAMELKLEVSKKILEGIVREDYESIAKQSLRLYQLSQSASWKWRQSDEFQLFTGVYRRSSEKLAEAAAEKNLDAITLEYHQLTSSCVNCHRYMRGTRLAGGGLESYPAPTTEAPDSDFTATGEAD